MAEHSKSLPVDRDRTLRPQVAEAQTDVDPLLSEEPYLIRDDEPEVYDLGFIIEDRSDDRGCCLPRWRRPTNADVDKVIEKDPVGRLQEVVRNPRVEGLQDEWRWPRALTANVAAEIDEARFAIWNGLDGDPDSDR